MASYHSLPPDTHTFIPAGRLFFGRAGLLPAELHQLTLAHALFFQIAFRNTLNAVLNTNKLALNWVCFHQVSNPINFSYPLVIIVFAFILPFHKLGLFFQINHEFTPINTNNLHKIGIILHILVKIVRCLTLLIASENRSCLIYSHFTFLLLPFYLFTYSLFNLFGIILNIMQKSSEF